MFDIHTTEDILGTNLIENPLTFKAFKDNAESYLNDPNNDMDVDVAEHVKILNQLPDTATRWCCSGHIYDAGTENAYSDRLSIILVVHNQTALDRLFKIVMEYNRRLLTTGDSTFTWDKQMQISCCHTLTHVYNDVVTQYPIVCVESLNECPLDVEYLDLFLQVIKDTIESI